MFLVLAYFSFFLFTKSGDAKRLAYLVDFIEVKATTSFLGNSYYISDITSGPKVSSNLVALIRYALKPLKRGEPGRPLEEIERPFPCWSLNAHTAKEREGTTVDRVAR